MTTKTTLCTYTYNDTPFVNDLLKHIPSWTCLPDKIVIVDDGSQSPFSLADIETILPIEIIRSENNQGIPTTKSRGISSATTDYIFSIDCDTRVSPNYLERCLEHVKKLLRRVKNWSCFGRSQIRFWEGPCFTIFAIFRRQP